MKLIFLDLRVRDAVFLLSNYSRTWDELTSVFSEVSCLAVSFAYFCCICLMYIVTSYLQKQIMIIDGDEFVEKPSETLKHVEQFLNIPEFFSPTNFVFTGDKLSLSIRKSIFF